MQLRTEIEIAAPPAAVWAVLSNFVAYPEWNPFIVFVMGEPVVGSALELMIALPNGKERTFRPTVLIAEPERELRWLGHFLFRGLFDGEHFFKLVEIAPNRTRFVHGEDFSGVLVRFAKRALTDTARGFVLMNHAVKRRVETGKVRSAG